MQNRYPVLVLILFFAFLNVKGQNVDSIPSKITFKELIFPTSIIGLGFLLNGSQFEQNLQVDLRNKVANVFESQIDDYTQYAPIAQMYIADLMGVKSKNHWFDQSKNLFISNLITAGITHGLKNLMNKARPDGSDYSFPSGHTAVAFTNAAVVYHEFHQTSAVMAYSAYAFAVTTGTYRVLNNKHWVSDVLVAAGIGILVTDLVYHFEPLKNFNPFIKSENISFIPQIAEDNYGFYFSYKF